VIWLVAFDEDGKVLSLTRFDEREWAENAQATQLREWGARSVVVEADDPLEALAIGMRDE
jgi:hypothetical protein